MINFRYHIVSLTAVFLSLIIGIVMGTTVVSKATVDGLRANLDRVEARSSAVQSENGELRTVIRDQERVDEALSELMVAPTVRDTLTDVPVLVIASKGIDRDVLDHVVATLADSGADVDGSLLVNDRLNLTGENAKRLADVLGVDEDSDVRRTLLTRLATELSAKAAVKPSDADDEADDEAGGEVEGEGEAGDVPPAGATTTAPPDTTPDDAPNPDAPDASVVEPAPTTSTTLPPPPTEPDLITGLRRSGFLEFRAMPGAPADGLVLSKSDYRYVVISGPDPDVPNAQFLVPLIRNLAALGPAPLVAASAYTGDDPRTRTAFTGVLNDNDVIEGRISTVDNLESYSGLVSLVYALQEVGEGRHGRYGLGSGTSSVVPSPSS